MANTNYPTVNIELNNTRPILTPILSKKTPPKSGSTMFGKVYTSYKYPN